ncbi:uncharacterized protein [Aegilops tauschii subsp. strangulata]|uniref:uncharacterized protein n=1 Tax=Aegilops tauschii subsp. strangulata TaxID=200361 RepID=UPI003CC867D7
MQVVSSGQIAVNINGEIGPCFPTLCGVSQGDHFSPFLFNMVVDALATILDKAKAARHTEYADDTIIMVEGTMEDITNVKFLPLCFQEMSGLKIIFDKSEVMGRWLSKAGQTILINSCLSSLLLFIMSFYSPSETLHHETGTVQTRFFWASEGDKQKYHMVRWTEICKPQDKGGLRIMSSKTDEHCAPDALALAYCQWRRQPVAPHYPE